MSTKITTCPTCQSSNIQELNPIQRQVVNLPLCRINCQCQDCRHEFTIQSWTTAGRRRGVKY